MKICLVMAAAAVVVAAVGASHVPAGALLAPRTPGSPPGAARYRGSSILRRDQDLSDQGFHYSYETSDGTKAQQQGRVVPGATQDAGSLAVQGSYSYVGTDGHTYSVTYTADENGYRAQGAHLPTPPPIPDAIQRSLRLQGSSQSGQYSSHAGYTY